MSDQPWPSEVRAYILAEHEQLRGAIASLETLMQAPKLDRGEVALQMKSMHDVLEAHRQYEEANLAPVLMEADAWGDVRTASLHDHHEVQHAHLVSAVAASRDALLPAEEVRSSIRGFLTLLRAEMAQEETELLDPKIVRDDVVNIGAIGG